MTLKCYCLPEDELKRDEILKEIAEAVTYINYKSMYVFFITYFDQYLPKMYLGSLLIELNNGNKEKAFLCIQFYKSVYRKLK